MIVRARKCERLIKASHIPQFGNQRMRPSDLLNSQIIRDITFQIVLCQDFLSR